MFAASICESSPTALKREIDAQIGALSSRDSFYHCLVCAARQFNIRKDGEQYILAGYPWFKCRARDTFIAMPGLTLSIGEYNQYEMYMQTASKAIRDFIEGRPISVQLYEMEQPDTLLWAIWCVQQYARYQTRKTCFEKYGTLLIDMIRYIKNGQHPNLKLHDNGLLYSMVRSIPSVG